MDGKSPSSFPLAPPELYSSSPSSSSSSSSYPSLLSFLSFLSFFSHSPLPSSFLSDSRCNRVWMGKLPSSTTGTLPPTSLSLSLPLPTLSPLPASPSSLSFPSHSPPLFSSPCIATADVTEYGWEASIQLPSSTTGVPPPIQ
eukprot:Phypoly_transcript_26767.p1 GENE.Phypoly_transcript_26767~~Phypoly_transcript_26767.p1  ORF type:complete len:142 (+),score=52.84 Phypoly_transcript_26767:32-457(+)